jgi:hypothetical protein
MCAKDQGEKPAQTCTTLSLSLSERHSFRRSEVLRKQFFLTNGGPDCSGGVPTAGRHVDDEDIVATTLDRGRSGRLPPRATILPWHFAEGRSVATF